MWRPEHLPLTLRAVRLGKFQVSVHNLPVCQSESSESRLQCRDRARTGCWSQRAGRGSGRASCRQPLLLSAQKPSHLRAHQEPDTTTSVWHHDLNHSWQITEADTPPLVCTDDKSLCPSLWLGWRHQSICLQMVVLLLVSKWLIYWMSLNRLAFDFYQ